MRSTTSSLRLCSLVRRLVTLIVMIMSSTSRGVWGDVTFASSPDRCTERRVGDLMDQEDKIDCEGAMYNEIPYQSIRCDARRINFANNNLTRLTRMSFRGLQQLEEIVLSGNRISYIEAETFAGMPNLKTVNLVDNLLSEIDERAFWRAQFNNMMVMVDGNPWYCDEDLKETIEAIEGKVTFIGLTCRGGFIRGIRGTIVGREFEDIRDRIENDFESWEIALIVSGSFAASVLVALIMYVVLVCRQGQSETFEEYPLQGTREGHRYLDNISDKSASQAGGSPVSGTAVDPSFRDSRKIHITSDEHFNPERGSENDIEILPSPPNRPEPPSASTDGRGGRFSPREGLETGSPRIDSPDPNADSAPPPPRPPPARGAASAKSANVNANVNEDEIHV